MGEVARRVLCQECPVMNADIKEEGARFGVEYVIFKSDERYHISNSSNMSWDAIMQIMENGFEFMDKYVPKYGKYEIEEYVAHALKEALLITKDATDILNTELLCDDFPYNVTKIPRTRLKEELLELFKVIEKGDNYTVLEFKWEKVN